MNGHYCDNCERHLEPDDYVSFGSWSYTCPSCGFLYHHGRKTAAEQVAEFTGEDEPEEVEEVEEGEVEELL